MAKQSQKWYPQNPGTVSNGNAGVQRITQTSVARVLADGVTPRVLQDNVVTNKETTVWVTN